MSGLVVMQAALRSLARHHGITFAEAQARFGERLSQASRDAEVQSNLTTTEARDACYEC